MESKKNDDKADQSKMKIFPVSQNKKSLKKEILNAMCKNKSKNEEKS